MTPQLQRTPKRWWLSLVGPSLNSPVFTREGQTRWTRTRLWETDVVKFEPITQEERNVAISAFVDPHIKQAPPLPVPARRPANQLALPFETYQEVRGTWFCE